jgi:hypothetical protein
MRGDERGQRKIFLCAAQFVGAIAALKRGWMQHGRKCCGDCIYRGET